MLFASPAPKLTRISFGFESSLIVLKDSSPLSISLRTEAKVVDLPDPVGPETITIPFEDEIVFLKFSRIDSIWIRVFKSSKSLYLNGYNNHNIDFIKKLKTKNKINVNLENDKLFEIRIK